MIADAVIELVAFFGSEVLRMAYKKAEDSLERASARVSQRA